MFRLYSINTSGGRAERGRGRGRGRGKGRGRERGRGREKIKGGGVGGGFPYINHTIIAGQGLGVRVAGWQGVRAAGDRGQGTGDRGQGYGCGDITPDNVASVIVVSKPYIYTGAGRGREGWEGGAASRPLATSSALRLFDSRIKVMTNLHRNQHHNYYNNNSNNYYYYYHYYL